VIDHIGFEVSDLERTGRFYDAVFFALGARRLAESEHLIGYGINAPLFFFVTRSRPPRPPAPGYGHLALQATGKAAVDAAHAAGLANGGADDGAPGPRPQYGRRYYAGYLLDPDRLRVEVVSRR
jgi:catechol 2,3-dioxygenase-like lactoylglutathione lyase family enzyme